MIKGAGKVSDQTAKPQIDVAAFLRVYRLRATNIMWLFGAGTSRLAGIKTAGDMIWDFKLEIYRSTKKLSPSAIADTSDPNVQQKIQSYFDELGTFPPSGENDEYAKYFEATYPHAKDRRGYLDSLISLGKPTFGHHALALLMCEGLCRMVWTTNFDRTVEDAAAKVLDGTGRLMVADLGEPAKVTGAMNDGRFPIYGKLHGDYHSDSLKNLSEELCDQDAEMRRALIHACQSNGLAIVGYSGRDDSIMVTLTEALNDGRGFPNGLFWFKRSGEVPYAAVTELIAKAQSLGIDAHLIENEAFDELMSDIVRFLPTTADKLDTLHGVRPPRLSNTPVRQSSKDMPFIRTNALAIVSRPVMCCLVDCNIGNWKEIEDAINKAGVKILAQRTKAGVIAFGRNADIRKAFSPYTIKRMDTRSIPDDRLTHENSDLALIRDSLFLALAKCQNIVIKRRNRTVFALPDPKNVTANDFSERTVRPVNVIAGTVGNTSIGWTEACALHLDYQLNQLWLLLEPKVILEISDDATPAQVEQAREFVRERISRRYNKQANALLAGWVRLLVGTGETLEAKGFNISDGFDPVFEISTVTAFSGVSR